MRLALKTIEFPKIRYWKHVQYKRLQVKPLNKRSKDCLKDALIESTINVNR